MKETTKDTKHNWFDVYGNFRTNTNMTTTEFDKLLFNFLDSVGWEFAGTIKYSEINDSDYE
jgi:hypothetical protein